MFGCFFAADFFFVCLCVLCVVVFFSVSCVAIFCCDFLFDVRVFVCVCLCVFSSRFVGSKLVPFCCVVTLIALTAPFLSC